VIVLASRRGRTAKTLIQGRFIRRCTTFLGILEFVHRSCEADAGAGVSPPVNFDAKVLDEVTNVKIFSILGPSALVGVVVFMLSYASTYHLVQWNIKVRTRNMSSDMVLIWTGSRSREQCGRRRTVD
jgi:hypothetical protein